MLYLMVSWGDDSLKSLLLRSPYNQLNILASIPVRLEHESGT